jgi:hypothetical protein
MHTGRYVSTNRNAAEVLVEVNAEVLDELRSLRSAVTRLEAERDCASVLARYGYYVDHGRRDEWVNLFTEDGVFENMLYYGDDIVNSDPALWRLTRFLGRDQLLEMISAPVNAKIVGHGQHHVGGPPSTFRLIDDENAVMVSYSVVYIKENPDSPVVQYQNHAMNRWTFRKVDGQWYIAENVRRKMGSADSGTLFEDF